MEKRLVSPLHTDSGCRSRRTRCARAVGLRNKVTALGPLQSWSLGVAWVPVRVWDIELLVIDARPLFRPTARLVARLATRLAARRYYLRGTPCSPQPRAN